MEKQLEKLAEQQAATRETTIRNEERIKFFEQEIISVVNRDFADFKKEVTAKIDKIETGYTDMVKAIQVLTVEHAKKQAVQDSWLKYGYPAIAGVAATVISILFKLDFSTLLSNILVLI
jgi:hypothetical protein